MNNIRKIDTLLGEIALWGAEGFDDKVHENFTKLKAICEELNYTIADINSLLATIQAVNALGGLGLTALSNGDLLVYDAATSKFKNIKQGTNGGLNADLLDNLESSEFMRKSASNTITQNIIFNNGTADSNGFGFVSNTGATPSQDINVDMLNGLLRFFRNSGLSPLSIGVDNNLYADNGTNGNGRILTTTTPLGYSTSSLGVGGTAVQDTNKSTAITLNKLTGLIVTANSALAAGASNTFSLNNNLIGANDGFYITPYYGYIDPYNYRIELVSTFSGGARIKITNISNGSLSEIVQFKFQVVKGVIS